VELERERCDNPGCVEEGLPSAGGAAVQGEIDRGRRRIGLVSDLVAGSAQVVA
jgi:hypothetical protein